MWRWLRRSLAALVLLLVVAYLFRATLVAPFVIGALEDAASTHAGIELEIEGLGGDWFSEVALRGVRTTRPGTRTVLSSVDLEELRVEYSLWDLARGRPEGLRRVTVRGLHADLDLRRLPPPSDDPPPDAWPAPPERLPEVGVTDLRVRVTAEDGDVSAALEEARVTAGPTADAGVSLTLAASVADARWQDRVLAPLSLDLRATWTPRTWTLATAALEARTTAPADGPPAWITRDAELGVRLRGVQLEAMRVADADLSLRAGAASWEDLSLASAEASVQVRGLGLEDPLAAQVDARMNAREIAWEGLLLEAAEASGTLRRRRLADGNLDLTLPDGRVVVEGLSVPLQPGLPVRERLAALDGRVRLETRDLPPWLRRGGLDPSSAPPLLDALALRVEKEASTVRLPEGSLRGRGGGLQFDGVSMILEQSGERVVATGLRVPLRFDLQEGWGPPGGATWPACRGHLVAALRTPVPLEDRPQAVELALEELEVTTDDGTVRLERPAVLRVAPDRGVRLDEVALATPAGALQLSADLPLDLRAGEDPWREGPLQVDARLDGFALESLRPWLAEDALPVVSGRADLALRAAGTWRAPQAELRVSGSEWRLRERPAALPDEAIAFTVAATLADGTLAVDGSEARAWGASLRLDGTWQLPLSVPALTEGTAPPLDGALDLRVRAEGADLAWIADAAPDLGPAVTRVTLDAHLQGTPRNPRGTLTGSAEGLRAAAYDVPEGTLAWDLAHDGARLEVRSLALSAEGLDVALRGGAALALGESPLPADGDVDLRLDATLSQPGAWSALLPAPPSLRAEEGRARVALAASGTWGAPVLAVEGDAELPRLRASASGSLRPARPVPEWLAGAPLALGTSDAHVTVAAEDLSWLADQPGIVRAQGALRAEVAWRTDGETAQWDGLLVLEDAGVRPAAVGIAAIERLDARARFDERAVVVEEAAGMLGASPFRVAGSVRLDGSEGPRLDLTLQGEDLLLYRAGGVKLRADADVTVEGPLRSARISGEVGITDGRMVRSVEFLRVPVGRPTPPSPSGIQIFALEEPLDGLQFDVAITTPGRFLVDNNVARGVLRPELRLQGTGAVPLLLGEIYLDETVMFLPATRMRIEQGVVRFLADDPFYPRLDLRGGMRRYGYDVTMLVTGRYDQPEVLLSSVPPLRDRELVTLVTTGQPPGERLDAEAAMGTVAIYLARDLIRTFFDDQSTEAEESILERLEIEVGHDATRRGEETIVGRFRILEDWLARRDALYVESEKDAYGDFNLGLKWLFRFD